MAISPLAGQEAAIRAAFEQTLWHTCTITRIVDGTADSENNVSRVAGTVTTGVPCRYEADEQAIRDEGGVTMVTIPKLTVSATLPIGIGDQVSNIANQDGGTPPGAAGTFRIERVSEATSELGVAILPTYQLKGSVAV